MTMINRLLLVLGLIIVLIFLSWSFSIQTNSVFNTQGVRSFSILSPPALIKISDYDSGQAIFWYNNDYGAVPEVFERVSVNEWRVTFRAPNQK